MISFVDRQSLDTEKYDYCIENAVQSRIYGYSWYLDIVCKNWSVLVMDNYKAVMPVPWKKRFFVRYIVQPFFCQQLGVFSIHVESGDLINSFIAAIPSFFLKANLQFNAVNKVPGTVPGYQKTNYILSLHTNYENIFKGFSKGRKHAVRQGYKNELRISDFSIEELIRIAKKHYNFKNFNNKEYDLLKSLVTGLDEKNRVLSVGVRDENNFLLGGAVFLIDAVRITYIFSAITLHGKQKQAASFLLDYVIKKYENTDKVLDFEGSSIMSIASFFKSFGAQKENYFSYKKDFTLF